MCSFIYRYGYFVIGLGFSTGAVHLVNCNGRLGSQRFLEHCGKSFCNGSIFCDPRTIGLSQWGCRVLNGG